MIWFLIIWIECQTSVLACLPHPSIASRTSLYVCQPSFPHFACVFCQASCSSNGNLWNCACLPRSTLVVSGKCSGACASTDIINTTTTLKWDRSVSSILHNAASWRDNLVDSLIGGGGWVPGGWISTDGYNGYKDTKPWLQLRVSQHLQGIAGIVARGSAFTVTWSRDGHTWNALPDGPVFAPPIDGVCNIRSDGRCGPNKGYKNCARWSYCNENTGWCGNSNAHRDAQASARYDMPAKETCTKDFYFSSVIHASYLRLHLNQTTNVTSVHNGCTCCEVPV